MITEFLLNLGVIIGNFFLDAIPEWSAPDSFVNLDEQINGLIANSDGTGVWIPWVLVIACVSVALASWVIGLAVKGVRAIASYFPIIGGAG